MKKPDTEFWKQFHIFILRKKIGKFLPEKKENQNFYRDVESIRKKIFEDSEFLELSKKLLSHEPPATEKENVKSYSFRQFFHTEKREFLYMFSDAGKEKLLHSFFSESKKMDNYLQEFLEMEFGELIDGALFLLSNEYFLYYVPVFSWNVDEETKKNFFVYINEDIFPVQNLVMISEDPEFIKIHNLYKNNVFFQKRVSGKFLDTYSYMILLSRNSGNLEILSVLLFRSSEKLSKFLHSGIHGKLDTFFYNFFPLFLRIGNRLLKTGIKRRMVIFHALYQIRKLLSMYEEILEAIIQIEEKDMKKVSDAVKDCKDMFSKHFNFLLIRWSSKRINFYFPDEETLYEKFINLLEVWRDRNNISISVERKKLKSRRWHFLDTY